LTTDSDDPRKTLIYEAQKFRNWADRTYPAGVTRHGEWECEYDDWGSLYSAYVSHLGRYDPQDWKTEDLDLLLYVLARDNENQTLQAELEKRSAHLIEMAKLALSRSCDYEARWQIADALGNLKGSLVDPLLELFFSDEHEYVRRRALLSLGRIGSLKTEELVPNAWQTGDEYQRMSALASLNSMNSPLLPMYLKLAEQDGRQYLLREALRIRAERARGTRP
jgi:HEAT repeats